MSRICDGSVTSAANTTRVTDFHSSSAEEWAAYVSHSFYGLAVGAAGTKLQAHARSAALPRGLGFTQIKIDGATLQRTSRLVASEPSDDLLFLSQLSGSSQIDQSGERYQLSAGRAMFFDPSAAYTISSHGHQIVTMVPRREVLAPHESPVRLRHRDISMASASLRVFRLLAEEVISTPDDVGDLEREGISEAAGDLLRTVATLLGSCEARHHLGVDRVLFESAKMYLLDHLHDSRLRMDDVARAHYISVRKLSSLFEPDDSPAAFLRRERLRRARTDLIDPRCSGMSTAEIGARWGLPEPSTFGRAFRREFGVTPRDVRAARR